MSLTPEECGREKKKDFDEVRFWSVILVGIGLSFLGFLLSIGLGC